MRRGLGVLLAAGLTLGAGACVNPRANAPAPSAAHAGSIGVLRVDRWTPHDALRAPTSLERQVFEGIVAGDPASPVHDGVKCVAREIAAFLALYRALPDETLEAWLGGYCGVGASRLYVAWTELDETQLLSDGRLSARKLGRVERRLFGDHGGPPRVGVGAHRCGHSVDIVAVIADEPAVELRSRGPEASGMLRIEGRLREHEHYLQVIVNQGAQGVAVCRPDPSVARPAIAYVCPLAPDDTEAWLEVLGGPNGNDLVRLATLLLVRPNAVAEYWRPVMTLQPGPSAAAELLAGLNALRGAAGVAPVALDPAESALIEGMYPQLFAAEKNHDGAAQGRLLEELTAGRAVAGVIRAGFAAHAIAFGGTAGDWLARAWTSPGERRLLLDPAIDVVAIGTRSEPSVGFGAALAAYSLYHDADHARWQSVVFDRIVRLRAERGLTTVALHPPPELEAAAREVPAGKIAPADALAHALDLVRRGRPHLVGVFFPIPFGRENSWIMPPEFLQTDGLACGVVVSHGTPSGSAWGELTVFAVCESP
jgi:hypothetical protein